MIILNGVEVHPTIFPDGTSQVWKVGNILHNKENNVIWYFESEQELIHLLQLCELLPFKGPGNSLYIPYLPYARQDKPVSNDATFALHSFARVLMLMYDVFDEVHLFDAHSRKLHNLLNPHLNGAWNPILYHDPDFKRILAATGNRYNYVIFPDKGAYDRYQGPLTAALWYMNAPKLVYCEKERDQQTGYITKFAFTGETPNFMDGDNILVIDDLCDGGKTFEVLSESLEGMADFDNIDLYVTHGLFSKGIGRLLDSYDNIITTNSLLYLDQLHIGLHYDRQTKIMHDAMKMGRFTILPWDSRIDHE